ncbi:hypothetical protein [Cellulomonas cellasea]|uniref:Phosphatidic acid phosphatase type 2/haloperoxidase domain-containing protein n=1 Tax=Cellulomonas cellasea TaxID=43670 RepID=A0A7W4YB80_9CELL|nr:hypothetical protein [Cellulomonas cellasea]MBB2923620.1 hypothetical protein [Cellulomonas cellasea]
MNRSGRSRELSWSISDRTSRDKRTPGAQGRTRPDEQVARALSRALGPLPSTVLATVVAAWAGGPDGRLGAVATTVGLFAGAAVLALALVRLVGGPGSVTRRRAVPWVLAAELVALAVGAVLGVPDEVVRAFAAYFATGLVALAGARRNVSAHGLLAGTLVGLLLGWFPGVGAAGVVVLAALVWARVRLGQHTVAQAVVGAAVGVLLGFVATLGSGG